MMKIDINGYIGVWPFRQCRYHTLEDIQHVHKNNGIVRGYISSLQSIFWSDPMRSEERLAADLAGSNYGQICTANPTLPQVERYIEEAVARFGIKAVRICPGYHGYHLDDPAVMEPLRRALCRHGLPLYITVQLEDPRLEYIVRAREIQVPELRAAADLLADVKILYDFMQAGDLEVMADLINNRDNVYADTAGFRGPAGVLEYILEHVDSRKLLYGSAYTLYTLRSSLSCIEQARVSDEVKAQILGENALAFFEGPLQIK